MLHLSGHECPNTLHITEILSSEENLGADWFFSNKKASKGPQASTEDVIKFTLKGGLAFAKKFPAVVNIWVTKMNGKTTKREKKDLCL